MLEGQIQKTGSRMRVTVQLVSSQDNATLWADKFDQESTDIFTLEDAISERVASKLLPQLTDADRKALAKSYTLSPEAQELYLKGRYFFDRDTEEDLKKGIQYYTKASERDPSYALAYAGIANAYCELVIQGYVSPSEAFGKAKASAVKALALDENLAEAHSALGTVAWAHDWDWADAEREYRRALELNAHSPAVHGYYAFYLVSMGRSEEAIAEIQRAVELDPVSLSMTQEVGFIYLAAHRYDDAILWFNRSLELDSRGLFARALLAASYAMKGDRGEVVTECKQIPPELLGPGEQLASAYTGFAYALSGQPSNAKVILKDLQQNQKGRYIDFYLVAGIYAGLGERDLAIRWLNLAYEQRSMSMVFLNVELPGSPF
jgi:tetratricopeptide (TPR) repeat protein